MPKDTTFDPALSHPEPDFSVQTGEAMTDAQRQAWFRHAIPEMRARGAAHIRASWEPDHKLLLLEGWRIRPEHEPPPNFALTAKDKP